MLITSENQQKLAVIGAGYLQLPLVKKAKEMGLEVHCFSWKEGAVCKDTADCFHPISILEKEDILTVCRREHINAVATIASDAAVPTVTYVAAHMGLVSNDDAYSRTTTNKYRMRQCFHEHGVPSPRYWLSEGSIPSGIQASNYPLIVKPTDRSGSKGVEKIDTATDLQPAIDRACAASFEHKAIVEAYVEGREISVEALSFQGKHHILQFTDKVTTGEPYYVELEHHQPSTLSEALKEQASAIVMQALDALHIEYGASHSELMITEDGSIYVIEIGARMGGDFIGSDLVRLSTGYDFLKGVIEVALGNFTEPKKTHQKYAGVYFLSKETEQLKPIIEHHTRYPEIVEAELTDNVLRNIECSGDRSGYLIYQSTHKYVPEA